MSRYRQTKIALLTILITTLILCPFSFATQIAGPGSESLQDPAEKQVRTLLQRWSRAWQAQDVNAYIDCYSKQFPLVTDLSRQQWLELRTKRLLLPSFIELDINDLQVQRESDTRYQATFTQHYRSTHYQDKVTKQLVLLLENGKWRISEEKSHGALPRKSFASATTKKQRTGENHFIITIGPCITKQELHKMKKVLDKAGLKYRHQPGNGQVRMYRFRDGVYPMEQGVARLKQLKKIVPTTYPLPAPSGQLGIYLAAVHDHELAIKHAAKLAQKGIPSELVSATVELSGQVLITETADQQVSLQLLLIADKHGLTATINELIPW